MPFLLTNGLNHLHAVVISTCIVTSGFVNHSKLSADVACPQWCLSFCAKYIEIAALTQARQQ